MPIGSLSVLKRKKIRNRQNSLLWTFTTSIRNRDEGDRNGACASFGRKSTGSVLGDDWHHDCCDGRMRQGNPGDPGGYRSGDGPEWTLERYRLTASSRNHGKGGTGLSLVGQLRQVQGTSAGRGGRNRRESQPRTHQYTDLHHRSAT